MTKVIDKKTENNLKRMPLLFSIETSKLTFDENGAPDEIQVLMVGKWNHPMYGPIIIEEKDIAEFKENFDAGLRRDIPITEGHESFDEKPAVGWFRELIDKGNQGLWAKMDWTPKGRTLLAERAYKYFSPEFYTEYEDPETRGIYKNVLVGGALTNKPYFKRMKAVVLSEKSINNNYIFNDMNIKDITAKKIEELTPEEIAFLKENKEGLSTDELAAFGSVLEEAPAELTQEQKDANVAAGLNEDGSAKAAEEEPVVETPVVEAPVVEASENKKMISIPASEYQILQNQANQGAQAFAELRKKEIGDEVAKLTFSEQNSAGKFLPKQTEQVAKFMEGLTAEQRKTFAELVKEIPSSKLFGEVGADGTVAGTAALEIKKRTEKLMSEGAGKLKFSDATKQVLAADPDLANQYEVEMASKQ